MAERGRALSAVDDRRASVLLSHVEVGSNLVGRPGHMGAQDSVAAVMMRG